MKKLATNPKHIRDLVNDPKNARKHNPQNIGTIVNSLHDVGASRSIVVDETNTILAGNGVVEAAAEAGITKVQIVEADGDTIIAVRRKGLTKRQKTNLALYDNRSAEQSTWDTDTLKGLLTDIDADERNRMGFDKKMTTRLGIDLENELASVEKPVDKAEALNKKWKVKRGDRFAIGDHILLCGDSTNSEDVKRCMKGAKPWLMVTDPPYGVDYDPNWRNDEAAAGYASKGTTLRGAPGGSATGKVTNDSRIKWAATYSRSECEVAYIWHATLNVFPVASDLIASGFSLRSHIIWTKTRFAIGRGDYHWQHEGCFYAVKEGCPGRFTGDRKNTTLWADIADSFNPKSEPFYACQVDKDTVYAFPSSSTTIWKLKNDPQCEGGHSTQKPVECMARPIRNHGQQGDCVYDPFSGTGTTGIAAHKLHRKARMIELEPKYCAVILERFKSTYGITGTRI